MLAQSDPITSGGHCMPKIWHEGNKKIIEGRSLTMSDIYFIELII